MLRSLKIGTVLAASTAALALGIAVPASAAPDGAQAITGTAFSGIAFQGTTEGLNDANTTCAALSAARQSARVDSGTKSFNFYSDSSCSTLVGTATPLVPAPVFLDPSTHMQVSAVAYIAF